MTDATTPESTGQSDADDTGEPQQSAGRQAKTWIVAAVVAGLAAGIGAETQGAFTATVDFVKDLFTTTDPHDDVPLTAKASFVDPWDVCEGGGGMVYLKPPTLPAIEQEFGKRWKINSSYSTQSTFDSTYEAKAANYTIVNLLIQGKSADAVVIKRIRVKPVEVRPAPKALRLRSSGGCGDANMSRFSVDLDSPQQQLKFKDGKTDQGKQRVSGFPYRVTKADPEAVVVVPVTNQSYCRFDFLVEWESGEQSGVLEVGDGDHQNAPFEVVSGSASPKYSIDQDLKARPMTESKVVDPLG
ncbi:hypothetical protein ACFH04_31305 [Streptomyces noboritoensis]|uniref:Secreted protein n=1 Tax=Streptomyces noboritoensis TaxID=67337 RepID=A0ABV6TUM7_9ACTN